MKHVQVEKMLPVQCVVQTLFLVVLQTLCYSMLVREHEATEETRKHLFKRKGSCFVFGCCCCSVAGLSCFHSVFKLMQGPCAISPFMIEKLCVLAHLPPLLSCSNPSLQKTAISLLSNMSRSSCSSVQSTMGEGTCAYFFLRSVFPTVIGFLLSSTSPLPSFSKAGAA